MWQTARWLFLLSGALWVLIGLLTPIMLGRWKGPQMLFVSPASDRALFGSSAEEILATNSHLDTLRTMLIRALAGMMLAAGILTVGVATFGLRDQALWALILLTVVAFAVLPYWWLVLTPYRAAHVQLGLGDLPPFMWVPALLMPLGSALGWAAHLRG